ncbi:hypothetical protein A3715_36840 [Oleiphilus sp. HI0009]|nr:hypothetical protein A3715_36840 [Oleiphilus sp. HI0009]
MKFDHKIYSTSNLFKPSSGELESYFDHLSRGTIVNLFEDRFRDYHSSQYCLSFSTGFWALVASIIAKTNKGGAKDVLMPSMTYRRLADVVNWTGMVPKFIDIDPNTLALSVDKLSQSIDQDSALILPVHPIVNCCPVQQLIDVGRQHNVPVLFDAVESVHETVSGKRVGSFGVGEVFSLHASKLINGIEGGYVCTDDQEFFDKLKSITTTSSSKYRLPYIQADIHPLHCVYALAGLDAIERNVSHNRQVYEAYEQQLKGHPFVRLLHFDQSEQTSFKNIVVEFTETSPVSRDDCVKQLNFLGIQCRAHYYPPLHDKSASYATKKTDLKSTNELKNLFLNLPCGQRFAPENAKSVVVELNKLFGL